MKKTDLLYILQLVKGKVRLKHGDRLVIGGNHYFKVSNPEEDDGTESVQPIIDFDYAYEEILRIQEEKCVINFEFLIYSMHYFFFNENY